MAHPRRRVPWPHIASAPYPCWMDQPPSNNKRSRGQAERTEDGFYTSKVDVHLEESPYSCMEMIIKARRI